MNIILIGNNGAGKTTMAQRIHKLGFHLIKEAPTGTNHLPLAMLTLVDGNWVMDRWNVVDRAIYEGEKPYAQALKLFLPQFKKHNVVIYLINNAVAYNPEHSEKRVIQRPSEDHKAMLDISYSQAVGELKHAGFDIITIEVSANEDETFERLRKEINKYANKEII